MNTTQQPEALNLEEFRAKVTHAAREPLLARIAELEDVADMAIKHVADLEAQLSAIGAGGVEPLRKRDAQCLLQIAEPAEPSPTAGMNIAQRILHVGGRDNAAGYIEFGSIQAVEALVRQVLRDLPAAPQAVQPAVPVGGQSRFKGEKDWQWCSVEHVAMVLATPSEWQGYEARYVYAHPAEGVPALAVQVEVDLPDVEDMAHSALQEALSFGFSHDVLHRWMRKVMRQTQEAIAATNPIQQGLDAQTTRDAVIQHLTSAGVLEHDGCGIFIASGDASELIDACIALSTHAHHEKGAAAQAAALLATGGQAQAMERIAIDMKQAAELLDLFGGEPTEFTVMQCNGHSGPGLYAYITEYPEDGASYLGKTDCEAQPAPRAQADAQDTDRWMGIGKAIERACMDLPDNTEVIVSLEKGAGTVTMIDQDGNEHENFSCDYGFAGVLNEAIDAALAAQAKQGGADHG